MMPNNLNEIISAIFCAAMGETETKPSEKISALFDRLSVAAQTGDTDFFRQLVEAENQKSRKKNEPTLLMAATLEGKADIVRALIAAGADVNAKMQQFLTVDALEFAVDKGYADIVKILLDAGADPNWNNQNPGLCPILKTVRQGNAEIVRMLIDAGAAVKFGTGFRLLVEAAEKSTAEIVQILIDAGCNVNTRNSGGDTPLTAACKRANAEVVRTLIAAGANVNKTGMHEFTPIVAVFYAPKMNQTLAEHGFVEKDNDISSKIVSIVQMLLDAGANLNDRDLQGRTPLMLAVMLGFVEIAKILIAAGADVNAMSQPDSKVISLFRGDGISRTALHFAVEESQKDAIALLLEAGADPDIRDSLGNSALDVVMQKGLTDIATMFQSSERSRNRSF